MVRCDKGQFVLARFTMSRGVFVDVLDKDGAPLLDDKGAQVQTWQATRIAPADVEAVLTAKAVRLPSGGDVLELTAKELGTDFKMVQNGPHSQLEDYEELYAAIKAHLAKEQFATKLAGVR
jgi:hypothetical protein